MNKSLQCGFASVKKEGNDPWPGCLLYDTTRVA